MTLHPSRSPRFPVRPSLTLLALLLAACGSSSTGGTDQLTAPPADGSYHGLASSSVLGKMVITGTVTGSSASFTFKDAQGHSGAISGTFALSGSRCFTGSAALASGARPFALVDCTMKDGRLSATVQSLASGTPPQAALLGAGLPETMALQSAASTPISSGTIYAQYNYDNRHFTPFAISSNTDELVMSNYVAGAMLGHLLRGHAPSMALDRDRIYAAILAHLLQEDGANLKAAPFNPANTSIDTAPNNATTLAAGGPYQINSWYKACATTWNAGEGTYYGLVNAVALQKKMAPFTVTQGAAGAYQDAPAIFNDKYWGPMATAYYHYLDFFNIENLNNAATPSYDMAACKAVLTSSLDPRYNVLDLILNASYNSGAGTRNDGITATEAFIGLCQNATSATTQSIITGSLLSNSLASSAYATSVGITSTTFVDTTSAAYPFYLNYGRQLRFTEDQMNGPSAGVSAYPTSLYDTDSGANVTPAYNASVVLVIASLETVFENVMSTLYYRNASGTYGPISASDAQAAFVKANGSVNTGSQTYVQMTSAADRKLLFDILDAAIDDLKTTLANGNTNFTSFADITQTQL